MVSFEPRASESVPERERESERTRATERERDSPSERLTRRERDRDERETEIEFSRHESVVRDRQHTESRERR